jgi:hypothetical protein
VLLFTEGNAAGSIEFEGPAKDSVPLDMITDYGQKQDTAIKDSLPPDRWPRSGSVREGPYFSRFE